MCVAGESWNTEATMFFFGGGKPQIAFESQQDRANQRQTGGHLPLKPTSSELGIVAGLQGLLWIPVSTCGEAVGPSEGREMLCSAISGHEALGGISGSAGLSSQGGWVVGGQPVLAAWFASSSSSSCLQATVVPSGPAVCLESVRRVNEIPPSRRRGQPGLKRSPGPPLDSSKAGR